jgi:hypothetical protein
MKLTIGHSAPGRFTSESFLIIAFHAFVFELRLNRAATFQNFEQCFSHCNISALFSSSLS